MPTNFPIPAVRAIPAGLRGRFALRIDTSIWRSSITICSALNRLAGPLFDAKELVELVDFRPDLFLGL
jgi:hypothetical protein